MQVVCGLASALTEFRIELREARQSPSLPWVRPRQLRNFRINVVAEAMVLRSEDEAINENSGGVGPFRGLPALPKGRGKAALRSWAHDALVELSRQGLAGTVTATEVQYSEVADERLGGNLQKLFGVLLDKTKGPLRNEPETLRLLQKRCGSDNPYICTCRARGSSRCLLRG